MEEARQYMMRALTLALEAYEADEVPVGALLVLPGGISYQGRNHGENRSPLRHAEMEAIQSGLASVGRGGLAEATLYVTLEPCLMCLGAMVLARIGGLVYACNEPRFGGVAHLQALWSEGRYPHHFPIASGLMEKESSDLLKAFFSRRRG